MRTKNVSKPIVTGRAMNFTSAFQDNMRNNGLETGSSVLANKPNIKEHNIDDVSMDEGDDEYMNLTNIMSSMPLFNDMMNAFQTPKNLSTCTDRDGKIYKLGEKFNRGCEETCQCLKNGVVCSQLCKAPYHVKEKNKNANCVEGPIEGNPCCVTLSCSSRTDLGNLLLDYESVCTVIYQPTS